MCGIIGYTGSEKCVPILLDGLDALSYRGYDSAGISVNGDRIDTVKASGRITRLREKLEAVAIDDSGCGIGHTRWATHGAPSDINAHPHATENLSLVHNGIIENYSQLSDLLKGKGYTFISETDSEIAAKLIDSFYKELSDPKKAMFAASDMLKGSYAFAAIFKDRPNEIYAIRHDSPLIVSSDETGAYVASDITALVGKTTSFCRPDDGVLAVASPSGIKMTDRNNNEVECKQIEVTWNTSQAQRGGYEHFMLKEIHEEPEVLERTVNAYVREGLPYFESELLSKEKLEKVSRIHIVACGTAMHAGLIGKNIIERDCGIPVNVEIASEFRYREPILKKDDLLIIISQSGETADTLAVLRYAKSIGIPVLSIVNVIGSTIASESDSVIYTYAGPEIAVASTKAYIVQCAVLYLIAYRIALLLGTLPCDTIQANISCMQSDILRAVKEAIDNDSQIIRAAEIIKDSDNLFYIGRCIDYDICTEGSLKLKEISYIHSEAFAAGELKHGTISLVTEDTPIIAWLTDRRVSDKMITAIREVRARGAKMIVVAAKDIAEANDFGDAAMIVLPEIRPGFELFPSASVMQLLAYHTSVMRGNDVDKPRNLAKSVTVE